MKQTTKVYKIRLVKVGKVQETIFFLNDFLKKRTGRELSFMLRNLPIELSKTVDLFELDNIINLFESLENKIEILEKDITITNLGRLSNENSEKLVYTSDNGFVTSFKQKKITEKR